MTFLRYSVGLVGVLAFSLASALSPPPPLPIDELTAFYHAMDGDNWHRNDGWLDPDVPVCDWYGITCVVQGTPFGSFHWVGFIRLADNNLSGELTPELLEVLAESRGTPVPSRGLDLSGNRISGELAELPTFTAMIRLADNALTGPLPDVAGGENGLPLEVLDLSGNMLTGPVPANWAALELAHLNLSSNLLEGSIQPALAAIDDEHQLQTQVQEHGELWLADNGFDGVLDPDWFVDWQIGSINLCWTGVEIDDPELDDWIADHHLGGPHHACLDRERLPLDLSASGSWYDPERDGEGFTMMVLDTGDPLIYWFTHISGARQMWQFAVGGAGETTLRFRPMSRTRGRFEEGFAPIDHPIIRGGRWRLDRVGDETLHGEHLIAYTRYDLAQPGDIGITWPPIPDTAVRRDYQRLTRLAGTHCDNRLPHDWISGAWYNPGLTGQGFVVEVIENGRGVVYWFTYTPESHQGSSPVPSNLDWQAWMMGDGDFDGTTLTIDNLIQPRDTDYGMPFDASGIEAIPFGTLVMEFEDDLNGHIWFDSVDEAYGSGNFPIERLARPMLAECE